MNLKGGRASLNGVTFYSENFTVKAFKRDKKIYFKEEKNKKEQILIDNIMSKIPFIRGVWVIIKLIIQGWKDLLRIFILAIPLLFVQVETTENPNTLINFYNDKDRMMVLFYILVFFIIKFSSVGKYHAAEHMVAHAYKNEDVLNVSNVKKYTRVHENCGTNFVVFLTIINFLFGYVFEGILLTLLTWSVAYEILIIENKHIRILLKPFYILGSSMQYIFFTAKPKDNHLEVSIMAMNRLIELEERKI